MMHFFFLFFYVKGDAKKGTSVLLFTAKDIALRANLHFRIFKQKILRIKIGYCTLFLPQIVFEI